MREQRMCLTCDGKWCEDHKCKNSYLVVFNPYNREKEDLEEQEEKVEGKEVDLISEGNFVNQCVEGKLEKEENMVPNVLSGRKTGGIIEELESLDEERVSDQMLKGKLENEEYDVDDNGKVESDKVVVEEVPIIECLEVFDDKPEREKELDSIFSGKYLGTDSTTKLKHLMLSSPIHVSAFNLVKSGENIHDVQDNFVGVEHELFKSLFGFYKGHKRKFLPGSVYMYERNLEYKSKFKRVIRKHMLCCGVKKGLSKMQNFQFDPGKVMNARHDNTSYSGLVFKFKYHFEAVEDTDRTAVIALNVGGNYEMCFIVDKLSREVFCHAVKAGFHMLGDEQRKMKTVFLKLQDEKEIRSLLKTLSDLNEKKSGTAENNSILIEALGLENNLIVFKHFGVEKAKEVVLLSENLHKLDSVKNDIENEVGILRSELDMKEMLLEKWVQKLEEELFEIREINTQLVNEHSTEKSFPNQKEVELLIVRKKLKAKAVVNLRFCRTGSKFGCRLDGKFSSRKSVSPSSSLNDYKSVIIGDSTIDRTQNGATLLALLYILPVAQLRNYQVCFEFVKEFSYASYFVVCKLLLELLLKIGLNFKQLHSFGMVLLYMYFVEI